MKILHQLNLLFFLLFLLFHSVFSQTAILNTEYQNVFTYQGLHVQNVTTVAFDKTGNYVASGDHKGKVLLWNAQNGKLEQRFDRHTGKITDIQFSEDNKILATASYDGTIKVWDIKTGNIIQDYQNPAVPAYDNVKGYEPTFVVFDTEHPEQIYFGGNNRKIMRADIRSPRMEQVWQTYEYSITSGKMINGNLAIGYDGKMAIFNTKTNQMMAQIGATDAAFDDKICELDVLPSKNILAGWTVDGRVLMWDIAKNKIVKSFQAGLGKGSSVFKFSKDEQFLLTGFYNNSARLWNIDKVNNALDVKEKQKLGAHRLSVKDLDISHDNSLLATADGNKVRIWKKVRKNSNDLAEEKPERQQNFVLNEKINLLLHFERSKDVMIDDSEEKLDKVVDYLKRNQEVVIELHGHTDNVGIPRLNLELSGKRTLKVKNYLVSKGIEAHRITIFPHGQEEPITSNRTEAEREQNRRVEMIVRKR